MILITTAGKVGSETAWLLAKREVSVRVLVRDPEKATALAQAGVEVAEGDLEVPATIEEAMQGVSTVVLVSPGVEPAQEINVVDAAARAGVGHVVKLTSKASPDSQIARQRWHAQIERGLAASGLPHTLLRSNAYMQNTLMLAPSIARTGGFASSIGAGRVGMVDSRDVADTAAAIAADPAGHAGKTYWLSGPELVTYADVATALSRLLGRTVTFRPQSREEDEAAMVRAGLPQPVAAMNALALSLFAEGEAEWLSRDVPNLLGRPARSYERFATDHVAAFS